MFPENTNTSTEPKQKVSQTNSAKSMYNTLAALCSWFLLAGFILFPGTFTSLNKAGVLRKPDPRSVVQRTVQQLPSFWIAITCCLVGTTSLFWLWYKLKHNYLWLATRLFLYILGILWVGGYETSQLSCLDFRVGCRSCCMYYITSLLPLPLVVLPKARLSFCW